MAENLHEGHRDNLKNRFLSYGLDSFSHHNVLELVLFYAIPRKDTNEIAHRLMNAFGSFSAVLDAPIEQLTQVEGVGKNAATLLKMLPQLSRIYLDDENKGAPYLENTEAIGKFILPKFVGLTVESVYLLCMDNRYQVLAGEMISTGGTVNASTVTLRAIVEMALRCQATQVVMAHNHPKGFAIPSEQDVSTTHIINQHLSALGIHLRDHLVISRNDYVSMAQSGILQG